MARDPKVTRKAYEYKLGKDLVSKLDDKQIHLLSQYYNSLSDKETSEIDSQIVQGRNNTELHEMAMGMVEENESKKTPPKPKAKAKPKPKVTPKPKAKPIEEASNFIPATEEDREKYSVTPEEAKRRHQAFVDAQNKSKKPDKKAVTAIVKKFSAEKKEDAKQQSTNETIDPIILRLLGLEDAFDLDYDTYKTLLREKMAAGRMSKSQIPTEETELLTNEFKRVKSKTGRFKPKKKSVNISKVVQSGKKYNKSAVNTQKLLSGSKEAESTKVKVKGEAVTDSFENINQSLLGIDSLLKNILGEEKKESEQEENTSRKAAQKAEEEKSEKSAKKKATNALKGFKAPKMGFLDMIKRFFKNILLGGFILKALDWFQNVENQEKIQNVITFITDNLDKILLGIAALVGIGIGAKILGFLTLFSPLVSGLSFVLKGLLGVLMGPAGLLAALVAVEAVAPATTSQYDQNTGKGAVWNDPRIEPRQRKMLIEGTFGHLEPKQWDPDALDYYKQLHEELGIPLPDKFKNAESEMEPSMKGHERVYGSGAGRARDLSTNDKIIADIRRILDIGREGPTGDLTKSPIEGVGTHMQGRNLFGMGKHKYFDVNGKEISRKEFEGLAIAKMKGLGAYSNTGENQQKVTPQTPSVIPKTSLLGKQSSAPTADYGAGSDGGPKGYVIVPGHAAGLGAPGEMEITPQLADNLVANLRKRVGPDVPVKVINMHAETALTDAAFTKQQDRLKALEDQGYEVIELHMDASVESGASPGGGRGVILPMPGTDAINPVEADFAKNYGAFGRTHRGGLAGTNRGVSLIELGNMSPGLQKSALSGEVPKSDLDILTKPLEDSLIRGLRLPEVKPTPKIEPPAPPNTDQASAVLPLGGGGSGGDEIASASGGRAAAASFSSIDGNNPNPTQVGSIFNLTAVG